MVKKRSQKPALAQKTPESFGSKIWHYLLVLLVGLLLTAGIWNHLGEVLLGSETAWQAMRLEGASHALANGQILPQVDPEAWGGFGYAYNLFNGPLVTYLAAGLQFLVGSWAVVFNLILILGLIGAGVVMCYVATRISSQRALGVLAGIFYMTMPYSLGIVYTNLAVGELMVLVAAPLLLLGLYQLTAHQAHATRTLAVALALLILSHNGFAIVLSIMALLYILFSLPRLCDLESVWRVTLAIVVAVGLSAFFLLPMVETWLASDYGFFDYSYLTTFGGVGGVSWNGGQINLDNLLLGGGAGLTLGLVALFGLIGFWLVRPGIENKAERWFVTVIYFLGVVFGILTLPIMNWEWLPVAWLRLHSPSQLLLVTELTMSVIAAYALWGLSKEWGVVQQRILAVLAAVILLGVNATNIISMEREYLALDQQSWVDLQAVEQGEQDGVAGVPSAMLCADTEAEQQQGGACSARKLTEQLAKRGTKLKVLRGNVVIKNAERDGLKFTFEVTNSEGEKDQQDALIELPVIYYPGYQAYLDSDELVITQSEDGLVTVNVPKGFFGVVKVEYGMSLATKLGIGVTAVTVGLSMVWFVIDYLRSLQRAKEHADAEMVMNSVKAAVESVKTAAERESAMESLMLAMPTEPVKLKKRGRPKKNPESDATKKTKDTKETKVTKDGGKDE